MTDASVIQEDINYCEVHTDKEATLRCIRCNRYMCTQCIVQSPVGYICRECARRHDDKFFNAINSDPAIIFAVCGILTGIGAAIIGATGFPVFFLIVLGLPIGGVIGEAALRATKRRRGRTSHWFATAGAIIGGFAGGFIQAVTWYNDHLGETVEAMRRSGLDQDIARGYNSALDYALNSFTTNWSLIVFIAIVAFAVYSRYKMKL
ncbi:MAG TPA: hypothetical protein VHL11_01115 [Phototrophicaceae bacterium]|jgi:hypothetical protein|nr:hypothetical protein [Phototrophicaceae bacterium]